MAFDPYNVLKQQQSPLLPELEYHFKENHKIFSRVYYAWYRAVRDYVPSLGVTVKEEREKTKDKRLRRTTLTFYRKGTLKFHLKQVGFDLKEYFERKWPTNTANVVISEDHPVTFSFDFRKNTLKQVRYCL